MDPSILQTARYGAIAIGLAAILAVRAGAVGPDDFTTGPLIADFGPNAVIETTVESPAGFVFRHSFDLAEEGQPGSLNRGLESAARFLNMHARAGIDPANMQLALVIHGRAVHDVSTNERYGARHDGAENANMALIAALQAHGVTLYVCGQSAAYYDVETTDLLPGVEMALSAMTMHAQLQQQGYSINPF